MAQRTWRNKTYPFWQRLREFVRIRELVLRSCNETLRNENSKLLALTQQLRHRIHELTLRAPQTDQNSEVTLIVDWLEVAKLQMSGTEITRDEVLDFMNKERAGALAALEGKTEAELVLLSQAYQIWYHSATKFLESHRSKTSIKAREEFEESKRKALVKEPKVKPPKEPKEPTERKKLTPEEKLYAAALAMFGNEKDARAHVENLKRAMATIVPQPEQPQA